ncbi:hypothetical protein POM88_028962 [Heracleum sosnowskyi]|uniref:Uncharacterized protein n=1 Tax=Heracleum sosnowskyi TaxID=360622 RepID=A0AAD8MH71_9APIA|nr:hypothetical protein POM88_028962 [Heracleum sosnowskyi]
MQNDYVCGQSIDSGIAMISIAEYLVLDKAFPKASFDVVVHRSRISFSFYAYGMAKVIYEYESEHEYFNDGRGDVVAKRTRDEMVQRRKRNLGNASPKRKKERKTRHYCSYQ